MTRETNDSTQGPQLFECFIEPLLKCRAVEVLPQDTILWAMNELSAGRVSSGRELEVLLNSSHEVSYLAAPNHTRR